MCLDISWLRVGFKLCASRYTEALASYLASQLLGTLSPTGGGPMKQMRLFFTVLVFFVASFSPVLVKAQTTVNDPLETFKMEVQDFKQQIAVWERQAHIQIALVVAVVVFGALISAFQGSAKRWSKVATLTLGVATTICAGVNSQAFSADYRSFQRAAIEGESIIRKMNNIIANLAAAQPAAQDLTEFKAEFSKCVDDFNQVSKNLEGNTPAVPRGSQVAFTLRLPLV